ncbi:hypothetical protein P4H42_09225, partial [Paenibacillus macerans]|uniref:hypothetical protein n=1 Tax=Paenibacillus macerans TaxID=44252 RepID=UPI002DB9F280
FDPEAESKINSGQVNRFGAADMFEFISSRSLDRFVRRRSRRSEADLTGGMGQNTGKNDRD